MRPEPNVPLRAESSVSISPSERAPGRGGMALSALHGFFFRGGKWLLVLFALAWAIEIFLIQELTFRPGLTKDFRGPNLFWAQVGRFILNFTFGLWVLSLVPRRLLWLPFLLWQLWSATALGYFSYFHRPLALQTAKSAFSEGAAVAGMGLGIIGIPTLAILFVALVAKVALAPRVRRTAMATGKLGLFAFVAWLATAGIVNMSHPLHKMRRTFSFERTGTAYGYFWTWVGEGYFLGDRLLERAVEVARTRKSNRLADEIPLPPSDHVVIVQVESLEDSVVDFEVEGELVMPFLAGLREGSLYYKVEAIHDNGSADADFSMLTGRAPSPDVITYRLANYPYGDTLPKIFARAGYHTQSIHGLYGSFFDRRIVFEGPMGFDEVIFEEELIGKYGVRRGKWGVRDRDLLQFAGERVQAAEGKLFQFIITLTSHGPFNFLLAKDQELFPGANRVRPRYLNSMRYVDRALAAFYESLPEGALLVIYGDHESATRRMAQHPDGSKLEYVPYIIHHKGHELRTNDPELARGGSLHQLDLVTYIRNYALSLAGPETTHAAVPK